MMQGISAPSALRHGLGFLLAVLVCLAGHHPAGAQEVLPLRSASGSPLAGIPVSTHRGYAVFSARELQRLGWQVQEEEGSASFRWGAEGPRVEMTMESPFFSWEGEGVQLADAPYSLDGQVFIPVQFLVDVLPWKMPGSFHYEGGSWLLQLADGPETVGGAGARGASGSTAAVSPPEDLTRVVIIDAGHGGRDPGTVGPRGVVEKEVAMGVARLLRERFEGQDGFEVYLTRDDDTLVPIWRRGELATAWKGDRYGVFVSIHANALPGSPGTRGFETYFLSEARTEHERRVAALENAAMELEDEDGGPESTQDLGFILSELRNLDHQHWSALLAEYVQRELALVHPGPNRGVKQGPFAVITNTLMPAILVEVGFLSNQAEERLLEGEVFQEEAAAALAKAIVAFFDRYPPGQGGGGGTSGP